MPGRPKRMRYAFADESIRSGRSAQPVYGWKRAWVTPAKAADEEDTSTDSTAASAPYKVFKWVKTGQTVIHEDDEDEESQSQAVTEPVTAADTDIAAETGAAADTDIAAETAVPDNTMQPKEAVQAEQAGNTGTETPAEGPPEENPPTSSIDAAEEGVTMIEDLSIGALAPRPSEQAEAAAAAEVQPSAESMAMEVLASAASTRSTDGTPAIQPITEAAPASEPVPMDVEPSAAAVPELEAVPEIPVVPEPAAAASDPANVAPEQAPVISEQVAVVYEQVTDIPEQAAPDTATVPALDSTQADSTQTDPAQTDPAQTDPMGDSTGDAAPPAV
ncbi:hypothetical protein GGF46_004844 [Coemansia sp. RSA 552]|nr:hypothetical protein GGF46_004844 [Coemansia sp. RSA 552]